MHEESDGKKINIKQRLIGAMVLLALAAIIIPALLDFRDDRGFIMDGSNIPARPDGYRVEELHFNFKKDIPIPAVDMDFPVEADDDTEQLQAEKTKMLKQSTSSVKENDNESAGKRIRELQQRVDTKQPSVKGASLPVTDTWVVQLASLGKKDNALMLRERARKKGYPAFILASRIDGAVMYRVLVGPELLRASAETLRKRLLEDIKLEGIIVSHSQ